MSQDRLQLQKKDTKDIKKRSKIAQNKINRYIYENIWTRIASSPCRAYVVQMSNNNNKAYG